MKNYGLNLEKERADQSEQDWIFGAVSPKCIGEIPQIFRAKYLPVGEIQRGVEDTMDCASRAPVNIYAAKFTFLYRTKKLSPQNMKWLETNGYVTEAQTIDFSDAFVAINSGTTREGNSLKAPLDAIRKQGLIPKHMLPLLPTMTFDEYHNPSRITNAMRKLGNEFLARFTLNYERVEAQNYGNLLERDFADVAGHAWPNPVKGEYPRTSRPINHAFVIYKIPKFYAFDNYIDPVDGDFIKKLSSDYLFLDYGYRVIISSEREVSFKKPSFFSSLMELITAWQR